MKKLVLAVLMAGLVSYAGMAQERRSGRERGERPTPEKMAEKRSQMMKEKLGLSDEQYNKVYAINLEEAKTMQGKFEAKRKEREANREVMKKEMEANRKAYNQKLEKVLTPEQLKTFENLKKERRKNMRNKARKSKRS